MSNIDRYLHKLYTKPGERGGALGSVQSLYNTVNREKRYNISKNRIRLFLNSERGYTLNRNYRSHFPTKRVVLGNVNELHQADLIDMHKYSIRNDDIKFILLVTDCFSKFVWLEPLKNKTNIAVISALHKIYKKYSDLPTTFSTDKGKEFLGKTVQHFFSENDVRYVVSEGNTKAQFAERAVRTIKSKIFKYMSMYNTPYYLNVLQKIADDYNSTENRETRLAPKDVSPQNAHLVFQRLYGSTIPEIIHNNIAASKRDRENVTFKKGDFVRIQKSKGVFSKRYEDNFSIEIFKIYQVIYTKPIQYKITDLKGEPILGKFYKEELQKTGKNNLVEIEKIIREFKTNGKNMIEVKWKNYPKKFNSIILRDNIKSVS